MKIVLSSLLAVALAVPLAANAQVDLRVDVSLPTISFEAAPPLFEVEPGVLIVEGYEQELFFHDGWYWHRRDGIWFRAREWRQPAWVRVEPRLVPPPVFRVPAGHYRAWRHEEHREWKDFRRQEKREVKEVKREQKERHREEKREHQGKRGR